MNINKEEPSMNDAVKNERYMQRKTTADRIIAELKKDAKMPFPGVLERAEIILQRQMDIEAIFSEARLMANQAVAYFQQKKEKMILAAKEYEHVDFDDKSIEFLRTFKRESAKTIQKYSGYCDEITSFYTEFEKIFKKLGWEFHPQDVRMLWDYFQNAIAWMEVSKDKIVMLRKKADSAMRTLTQGVNNELLKVHR